MADEIKTESNDESQLAKLITKSQLAPLTEFKFPDFVLPNTDEILKAIDSWSAMRAYTEKFVEQIDLMVKITEPMVSAMEVSFRLSEAITNAISEQQKQIEKSTELFLPFIDRMAEIMSDVQLAKNGYYSGWSDNLNFEILDKRMKRNPLILGAAVFEFFGERKRSQNEIQNLLEQELDLIHFVRLNRKLCGILILN